MHTYLRGIYVLLAFKFIILEPLVEASNKYVYNFSFADMLVLRLFYVLTYKCLSNCITTDCINMINILKPLVSKFINKACTCKIRSMDGKT